MGDRPSDVVMCACGDRPADGCPGEWEEGCELGANEKFAKASDLELPKDMKLISAHNK